MNIVIFDTETTSLEKPFCYNIGYVIANVETQEILLKRDFVCEQVWHNPMLFTTAYYSNKRPIYIEAMRSRKTIMDKFGYICQRMIRDFRNYEVEFAFAFNSPFDEKVFDFNCDWFKCNNPFDNITIKDIRGFAHHFLVDDDYIEWCEENEKFTDSGNYSTTAEALYQYITANIDFVEDHTALSDSLIEMEILFASLGYGADIEEEYLPKRSIKRPNKKVFTLKENNEVIYQKEVSEIRFMKTKNTMIIKD